MAPDDAQGEEIDTPQDGNSTKDEEVWSPPEIKEFYQVTSKMLPVLQTSGYR